MKILLEKPKFKIVLNKTVTPTIKKKTSGKTHRNENINAKQNLESDDLSITNTAKPQH
jgi:hypothetical protein